MDDTIAAISTAQGVGAISIIRISGPKAFEIVSNIFSNKKFLEAPSHTIHYGYIVDNGKKIDEVLVSKMNGPKTFTCEDVAEINAHGGITTTNEILELVLVNGARLAEPGEFTKRAFLNGRIDLTEAEGIMDLINSKTDKAREMALNQVSGEVSNLIRDLRNDLAGIISNIEVNIDYPEYEDTPVMTNNKVKNSLNSLEKKINNILEKSNEGEIIKNGIKTVIAGKPNVGKSSLLNRLLGEDRAIVTDVQGTTRDSIEASLVIDNIVLNLIDTAGIRDTSDTVESIGVSKSLSLIDQADLVLFVLNYNEEMTADERMILEKIRDKNHIIIVNKTDLEKKLDTSKLDNPIYISIKDDKNIDEIKDRIKELFNLEKIETGDLTYLTSARSKAILRQVLDSVSDVREGIDNYPIDIVEIDLKKIWNLLGDIIGENYSEELLDELFSRFCVGK